MDWELFAEKLSNEIYSIEEIARDYYSGNRTPELYATLIKDPPTGAETAQ